MTQNDGRSEFVLLWYSDPTTLNRTTREPSMVIECDSLQDALEKALHPPTSGADRPWLDASGVLFSPGQIDKLREVLRGYQRDDS